jgi:cytokinin dehydrogenase
MLFEKSQSDKNFKYPPEVQKYLKFENISDYSRDFGGMVSKKPWAVFLPPTTEILQHFLKINYHYNKRKITFRGNGYSAYGQAQVADDGDIIIDLKNMETSLKFNSNECASISVPASKTWLEVLEFSLTKQNKTVPVTIDNLFGLTVAGTLSFGGIGGPSYLKGSCADHVLSLDVVTIDGKRHHCSKTENRELFDAALGGLGQFCLIEKVVLTLIPAKKYVNVYYISYNHATQFLQDQKVLYTSEVFDHFKGFIRKKDGAWEYVIEAASYYDNHENERVTEILIKLSSTQREMQTMPYWEFINMVTNFVKLLRDNGKLNVPHPWYNVFIPEHEVENHLKNVLDTTTHLKNDPIIIYPMNSDHFQQPLFIKPKGTFYLLGVLYNTSLEAEEKFPYQEILRHNEKAYSALKARGGCNYPVGAIPFNSEDWRRHYGEKWDMVCRLKEKYDPHH